jgi:spore maturation protein CgeB
VARLVAGPKGYNGLEYTEAGRTLRLTSAVDPAAEDRALVSRLNPNPEVGVICFGLGLGYHLEELARRLAPESPLWVLESRPELADCALAGRDLSALFKRPGFRLFIGPFAKAPWAEGETPPAQALWRPAAWKHFRDEYPKIPAPRPEAKPRPALRRLLMFQCGYFLGRELVNAARELGLTVATWSFQSGPFARPGDFKALLRLIGDFRPDLALTINHLGFDDEGRLDDILERLGLPTASWFVDSPVFILGQTRPGSTVRAFSWDRDYLPWLRSQGFNQATYLPLATDPSFFSAPASPGQIARRISFVGDSLTAATDKYLGKVGFTAEGPVRADFLRAADDLAADFLAGPKLLPETAPLQTLAAQFGLAGDEANLNNLAALITWRASRQRRLVILQALDPADLTVAGDQSWAGLLPLKTSQLRPPVDYYAGLAPFYRSSLVNLNITSAQMKTGLNQRVFDAPAAGGFLLTDDRAQLAELFEPGREVVTYGQPAEARELADWYVAHPRAGAEIARAARRRIGAEHLYRHRLAALLKEMGH